MYNGWNANRKQIEREYKNVGRKHKSPSTPDWEIFSVQI